MKEHRTKALRVTTPHSIESSNVASKDEFIGRENGNDLFGALQILQFELNPDSRDKATSSGKSCVSCLQNASVSSSQYSQSETMAMHTASITANPVFGKHDSFYRWFSSEFQNEQPINQTSAVNENSSCGKCNDNHDEETSSICHCRSTYHKKKHKQRKPTSVDTVSHSLPLFQSQHSHTIFDIVFGGECSEVNENWFLKLRDIKEVIHREKASQHPHSEWSSFKNANGDTALLVIGQRLLKQGQFDNVVELVKLFLEEGADVNVINNENRTLLSYSIPFMDKSIRLTTLLLNYGAVVWPIPAPSVELPLHTNSRMYEKYGGSRDCNSAFTWFLRGVIGQRKLSDHCLQTLYVLAETMGQDPRSMQSHVMTTMFSHARCYSILGPVFLQIKVAMSPYWSQPQSLKFLCRSAIRKTIMNQSGRFITSENVSSLMLPPSLQSYLMLDS